MHLEDPISLMTRETRIRSDHVSPALDGQAVASHEWSITPDAFVLHTGDGLSFCYQRGSGLVIERHEGISDATVNLFLYGSVYGAIAWINGLVPLHASAICKDRKVIAFTGDSGTGKSTLVAGLASPETPLFADDVLVLDMRDPRQILCLPGQKTLKLWADALELTGLERAEQVYPDMNKYYATCVHKSEPIPMPLSKLFFLGRSDNANVSLISGLNKISRLDIAFYRPEYIEYAGITNVSLFEICSRISDVIQMYDFERPLGRDLFQGNLNFIRGYLN